MAQFYWKSNNPSSNRQRAYEDYLQNSEYVNDITGCINYNSRSINSLLQENNATAQNINKGISNICSTLDSGFELLGNHLSEINSGIQTISSQISALSCLLDWKLSALIEGQQITNSLLGNISNLLKIPDSQKERVYFIEEGLKYLKNALMEQWDSDYFEDAYSAFNDALSKESKDYISLSKLGFIHLFSKKYLDFAKAEDCYRKAFRYANAELMAGGTSFSNTLNPLNIDLNAIDNIHLVSYVESMFYCARACALQNNFAEAIKFTSEAYNKVPTFLNAAYEEAKYLCLNGEVDKAVPLLKEIIEKDEFQTLKIIGDPDIICHDEVNQLLEELAQQKFSELKEKLDYLNQNIENDPIFLQILKEANSLGEHKTYLHSLQGINLLNQTRNWYAKQISYNKRHIDFLSIKGSNFRIVDDWATYILSKRHETSIVPIDLPANKSEVKLDSLTIFEYLETCKAYKKTNSEIIHNLVSHLEFVLNYKTIFGISLINAEEKKCALWLIEYYKNL